jgi:AAA family ATPase
MLSEMDGIEPLVNVTVVAATNRPDILDSALLRPGRIDSVMYVAPPNELSRRAIFENKLKKIPNKEIDCSLLAKQTDGFSGAETVQVVQSACLLAMRESSEIQMLEMRHFEEAIQSITKRITPEMLQFYQDFQKRSGLRSV